MRIYLDVSCLNRPFDDHSQARVRNEAAAITEILEYCIQRSWVRVASSIAVDEVDAMPDLSRRARVRKLLPGQSTIMELTESDFRRAMEVETLGIKPADALHVAAAEALNADVLLSCDDKLCRAARRSSRLLRVRVLNPIDWWKEVRHAETEDTSEQ